MLGRPTCGHPTRWREPEWNPSDGYAISALGASLTREVVGNCPSKSRRPHHLQPQWGEDTQIAPLRQGLPSQRVENQMCLAIWRATHKLRTLRHLAYSQEGVPEMLPRTQRTAHAVLFGVVFIIEFRQLLILKPAMHSNLAQCGALRSWQLAQFDLTGLGATPRVM